MPFLFEINNYIIYLVAFFFLKKMDEQTFDDHEINDYYQENFNSMNLDYFTSQVFGDAQSEITDAIISVTSSSSSSTSNPLCKIQ